MTLEENAVIDTGDDWDDIDVSGVPDIEEPGDKPEDKPEDDAKGEADETAGKPTEDETAEQSGDGKPEEGDKADQFIVNYLGENRTLTRDEAVAMAQKGMDYDRVRQKYDELKPAYEALKNDSEKAVESYEFLSELAKKQGFSGVDEFIDATQAAMLTHKEGIDPELARQRVALERKEREIAKRESGLKTQRDEQDAAKKAEQRKAADIQDFVRQFPDVKPAEIPPEVWKDVQAGASLVNAYMKHENALFRQKLEAERKAAENRQKSAGSRQTEGNNKVDPYDEGWYDDD